MSKGRITTKSTSNPNEEEGSSIDLRRGPWTLEEDNLLIHYITCNGEGRWNSLAKCAGLKRTGKSCRLRWLNYLKPDIRRGNLTPQEQLLILELHSKWGNRWSKIARHLPGRTDNEIKNYWRTRVQKQARQLNVDSNSKKFLEAIKCFWMPRLLEKMEQSSSLSSSSSISSISTPDNHNSASPSLATNKTPLASSSPLADSKKCSSDSVRIMLLQQPAAQTQENPNSSPVQTYGKNNSACNNSIEGDSCYHVDMTSYPDGEIFSHYQPPEMSAEAMESPDMNFSECQISEADNWFNDDMSAGAFWNTDELWHFRKPEVGI
ncbi:uncharacterized protein [Coffea arabica]|uniref:Uncharacterized protein n=1 Tax=Coffea arabica TaxID=13443 RepID=A0A6P6V1G9_COFAR|nr:transcription factor MYB62-like [Coffea arabica]